MLAYIVLFAILFLLSFLETSSIEFKVAGKSFDGKTLYCILIFFILSFFMGFRAESVGSDVVQYIYRYENVDRFVQDGGKIMYEWGYNYLSFFFHDILKVPFQVFLFFLSLITCFSVVFVLFRYSDDIFASLTMYLTIGNFTMSMSGLRQTLAISLLLCSIYFCEKKKLIPFLLLCLLAYSVHNSSIIFIFSFLLWGIQLTRKSCFVLFILSLSAYFVRDLLSLVIEYVMPLRYADIDLNMDYNINVLILVVPILMILFSLFFLDFDFEKKLNKKDSFFFVFSCVSFVLLLLSLNNNQLGRLSFYFNTGLLMIVPSALNNQIRYDANSTKIAKLLILIFSYAYFFISTPGGTLRIDNYTMFFL